MNDKVLGMLGLAARAGKVLSGEDMVTDAIKSRKAEAVIVASDASERSKKLFRDKCSYYHVPIYEYSDKEGLGHAIGKDERSSAAIVDRGLSEAIRKLLDSVN